MRPAWSRAERRVSSSGIVTRRAGAAPSGIAMILFLQAACGGGPRVGVEKADIMAATGRAGGKVAVGAGGVRQGKRVGRAWRGQAGPGGIERRDALEVQPCQLLAGTAAVP